MTKRELTEKFASIRGISHITREFTPEEMASAYVKGYEYAIDIACQVLEGLVMYRRSFFGRSEERVCDDDFIEKFRETTKIKE